MPRLGEEDVVAPGLRELEDGAFHLLRRDELTLLDVDRAVRGVRGARGPRRRSGRFGRQRNAGIWRISTTRAAGSACDAIVDVGGDRDAEFAADLGRARRDPCSRPGPRAEVMLVRLALSNEALKM